MLFAELSGLEIPFSEGLILVSVAMYEHYLVESQTTLRDVFELVYERQVLLSKT